MNRPIKKKGNGRFRHTDSSLDEFRNSEANFTVSVNSLNHMFVDIAGTPDSLFQIWQ